ncbi:CAP-Gly domain protein [Ceratobasidium sp. AG-Ba]|nr:CAP-Gly domain protein [Ceratobasidium sp. AG-Ba]QRW05462.1 CAP-Gly domain protein [Ceratobasidium sp. AG-Ba]
MLELDVQVEDMALPNSARSGPTTRTGLRVSVAVPKPDGDAESMSIHSLRTGVLNRNNTNNTRHKQEPVASSSRSIRSVSSRHSAYVSPGPPTRPVPAVANPTRLRPVTGSARTSYAEDAQPRNSTVGTPRRSGVPTSPNPPAGRPRSLAPSIISVRSTASTVRHSHRSKDSPSDEVSPPPPPPLIPSERPTSTVSNTSFKTANPGSSGLTPTVRNRKVSTASTASNLSVPANGRRPSNASGPPPTPRTAAARTVSGSSQPSGGGLSRSGTATSTKSVSARRPSATPAAKPQITPPKKLAASKSKTPSKAPAEPTKPGATLTSNAASKGKGKGKAQDDETVSEPRSSRSNASTLRGRPVPFVIPGGPGHQTRKSTDTVTASTVSTIKPSVPPVPRLDQNSGVRGVTLNVGIPCLIISKRAKYKAYARYIGEVHGELGPWVGVEVPVADSWGSEKLGGRQWNDGSIGGIRYFEVGSSLPWDDGEERASRRRRLESVLSGKKRDMDTMSIDRDRMKRLRSVSPAMSDMSTTESRGLFVRPSDVIYVFDAVDDA